MKPALMLLHGALGSSRHFDAIVPILSEQYVIHRFDFHGHGGTPLPSSPLSIETCTSQLLDYIRQNGLGPVAIFGYSMGGYVALHAALQAPEAVLRVQTLATKFNWSPEAAAKETRQLDAGFLREKAPAFVAQLEELHGEGWKDLLPATAGLMTALGANPLLTPDNLSTIHIPVRVMVGDRDVMVGVEETLHVFKSLPQASMAVLPDTKHPLDRVNNAVLIWEIRSFMVL
ncbi:alpha/beta fold hydrolase [Chitinophaga sp. GCM10012297]|uniref:Alpha/beta fold hydrolase n=1 Tax=Chitinophaga chungangae TaxID=2821488 RepID=A0ABS3YLD4_9BACT|nr:alpha/beta fold hydrolase [Chitinophaga chungangae]MBO9155230.1 alpha/beta fold hydrolase [Chitinophaga chungangae]